MHIAAPQVRDPKAQRAPSDDVFQLQEQPRMDKHQKRRSSIVDVMEKVEVVVEKGVNVVDPLNIFAPCIAPTRLVLKQNLFTTNDTFTVLECRTNDSYHNLVVKSTENDTMVIQDSSTGKTVVVVERTGEKPNATYTIFKTSAVYDGQDPAKKTIEGQSLYALAKVDRTSSRDFHVVMEQQTDPTYTIEKAGIPANYATNWWIKQVGVKEEVASTHPWEGNDFMLVVNPGMDVILMFCLAAITDDAEFHRTRRESFSEMVDKVNPRKLVRKITSSSSEVGQGQSDTK